MLQQKGGTRTAVLDASSFYRSAADEQWTISANALNPEALTTAARDARWRVRFVVAETAGTLVGYMPVFQAKGEDFPTDSCDPAIVAPGVAGKHPRPASDFLLIGGHTELVAGGVVRAGCPEEEQAEVIARLAEAAFALARDEGKIGMALYVRDAQLESFLRYAPRDRVASKIAEDFSLAVPDDGMDAYVSGLKRKTRARVRNELHEVEERSLSTRTHSVAEILDEALPLILSVKQRHGIVDHPRLVRMRLQSWWQAASWTAAFCVSDPSGELIAVSLAVVCGPALEIYEVGLSDSSDLRHLAYVEALLYAPMRWAAENDVSRLVLGLDSPTPKRLRGAVPSAVWAVAATFDEESGAREIAP